MIALYEDAPASEADIPMPVAESIGHMAIGAFASSEEIGEEFKGPPEKLEDVEFTGDIVRAYLNEAGKTPLLTAEQEVELSKRIEAGVLAETLFAVRSKPKDALTPEENKFAEAYKKTVATQEELQTLAHDGKKAKDRMLMANLRLVVSLAKRYNVRGMEFLDCIQLGNLGLIRAVEKFDNTKGYKFSTYATIWIRQTILRGIADESRIIRIPVHVHEKVKYIEKAYGKLEQSLGRAPTPEELAEESGQGLDKVEYFLDLPSNLLSLDEPIKGEDGRAGTLGDLQEDNKVGGAFAQAEKDTMRDDIVSYINSVIDNRDAQMLMMRFGILDGHIYKPAEIGRAFGIKRQAVEQRVSRALGRLRKHGELAEMFRDYTAG